MTASQKFTSLTQTLETEPNYPAAHTPNGTGRRPQRVGILGLLVAGAPEADPFTRSAGELIWLQVEEKQCWPELLETGKIDWRPTEPVLSLDDMIRAYEKAHGELWMTRRGMRKPHSS
jgi:hypothetical protein